jgi:hypothetical protein
MPSKPMTRLALAALLVALLLGALPAAPARAAAPSDLDLAFRWAPIHHQETHDEDVDADFVTAIDFDGDWHTLNNWENQDDDITRLQAVAYYSVVETDTHWFIIYVFYHPRDWCNSSIFCDGTHENDAEGILAIVRKNGDPFGQFLGMLTLYHSDLLSYVPDGSPLTDGQADIDGPVAMLPGPDGLERPATYQDPEGHAIRAWSIPVTDESIGDHIVYFPSKTTAEVPSSGDDRDVNYQLVDIFAPNGLWAHRLSSATFAEWGKFRGDNGADNAAAAPWIWDDDDDGGDLLGGEPATDPAKLVDIYFDGLGDFSHTYRRNSYNVPAPTNLRLGTVTLNSIQVLWNDNATVETYYRLGRRPANGLWVFFTLPANTTSYTHSGLSAGASYYYEVQACDANGCSPWSGELLGTAGAKLTVSLAGQGKVTSTPTGINCGLGQSDCSEAYAPGASVKLSAAPYINPSKNLWWKFDHWEGACAGSSPTCTVPMTGAKSAKAVFVQDPDGGFASALGR